MADSGTFMNNIRIFMTNNKIRLQNHNASIKKFRNTNRIVG